MGCDRDKSMTPEEIIKITKKYLEMDLTDVSDVAIARHELLCLCIYARDYALMRMRNPYELYADRREP